MSTTSLPTGPALSLDDLATAWLSRRITHLAAMPGLNNDLGAIQVEADIAAIKHPVFPPYSGGNEVTAVTLINGKNLATVTDRVDVRWRAHQIERRCETDGWKLESRTALLPEQPGVLIEVKVTNRQAKPRNLSLGFIFSGRSVNSGNEGYAWAVPIVPTDVFSFTKEKNLRQTITPADAPSSRCFTNEAGNAHAVHSVWPEPKTWRAERVPTWETRVPARGSFTVHLLVTFHADRKEAVAITRQWHGRAEAVFEGARARWERLWTAAFTPDNGIFSGHMPILQSPHAAMKRLYYNGVLTAITCRRVYPHCRLKPCYLTLWPRRGEGSAYLAWELAYTSGTLARLDPVALREMWLLLASAPELDYQTTNYFTEGHGGWACCAHYQSVYTAALNLTRWSGDVSWQTARIERKAKDVRGFEAASQGQVVSGEKGATRILTGLEAFRESVLAHRKHHLDGKAVVAFGGRGVYLECISNYAHGTAGHTAVQAWALRQTPALLGEDGVKDAKDLLSGALSLYRRGAGYFDCEYPDGSRQEAPNLYDIGLVLLGLGDRLPRPVVREIVQFTRTKLLTPTWAHCLWPNDFDVTSGLRCDHQWAGCFAGWVPQFVLGLHRAGVRDPWVIRWLEGVARVTAQGPFAQAYWAEDLYPTEAGAAAKCYDELTQGNHWVIGSGMHFAEMILDGVCGLAADLDGSLRVTDGLGSWSKQSSLFNIRCAGKDHHLIRGKLSKVSAAL